jgi:hypothetical protein
MPSSPVAGGPQTITSTQDTGPQKALGKGQSGGLWSRLRDKFTK